MFSEAVSELGGLEKWGVKHEQLNIMRDSNTPPIVQEQLSIEPYKFAMTLIETITNIINQIADATDFMDVLGVNPLPTDGKPNIPGIMDEIIDKRITILG